MTVSEAFAIFKSELELPEARQDEASKAQQALRRKLEATSLYISTSFLTGSYSRHTKINPLNDIDLFLVRNDSPVSLTTDGSGTGASQALKQVDSAVKSAYPSAKTTIQSRSVNAIIPGVPFGFDLVPAWHRAGGGYWIPDGDSGSWIPTNPTAHATLMTAAHEASGNSLKPLVKMAKHWSRHNYDRIRPFHLELICRKIITTKESSWSLGMATILAYLPGYLGKHMVDPIFGVSRVDKELSTSDLQGLALRVSSDASRALAAVRLENDGRHAEAIAQWKEIFLQGFPR